MTDKKIKGGPKQPKDVWVEDLRQELKLKGKAITRAACDRLINKWMDGRNRDPNIKGQNSKAYVPEEVAAAVKQYFSKRHNL